MSVGAGQANVGNHPYIYRHCCRVICGAVESPDCDLGGVVL